MTGRSPTEPIQCAIGVAETIPKLVVYWLLESLLSLSLPQCPRGQTGTPNDTPELKHQSIKLESCESGKFEAAFEGVRRLAIASAKPYATTVPSRR
jgi:hypothetical protein